MNNSLTAFSSFETFFFKFCDSHTTADDLLLYFFFFNIRSDNIWAAHMKNFKHRTKRIKIINLL